MGQVSPQEADPGAVGPAATLHHLEVWVPRPPQTGDSWDRLLTELDCAMTQAWEGGRRYELGAGYLVLESGADVQGIRHERRAPGMNHVALELDTRARVDRVVEQAPHLGWELLFAESHPWAGGPNHYAAYLENADGYEVELVAKE